MNVCIVCRRRDKYPETLCSLALTQQMLARVLTNRNHRPYFAEGKIEAQEV